MDCTLNTRRELEVLKNQYTKSLNEIDMEIRSSGKFMQWRYEIADLSGQLEFDNDELFANESEVIQIDDEKLKKDLLDVKENSDKKEVKDSILNPNSETEFKEPDPDEKIHIADPESGKKNHPL